MKFVVLCLAVMLSGCATIHEHKVATVVAGVVVTSAAISITAKNKPAQSLALTPPPCGGGLCGKIAR